jgi:hypothetical protein
MEAESGDRPSTFQERAGHSEGPEWPAFQKTNGQGRTKFAGLLMRAERPAHAHLGFGGNRRQSALFEGI